ncbi:MAG: transcriptional antiterminator NusG [Spirochaetes bacterium]|nr:transcriptional antiterminator NusG [Spirochaetota bacterium]
MSYYAIQIMSGREDTFVELLGKTTPDAIVFNIKKKIQSRRRGKPVTLVNPVFSGYIFMECPQEGIPPALVTSLKRTKGFARILPSTDHIKALNERDSKIIRRLVSFGKEIGPSLVTFDENNRIKVIEGPLLGMEGRIVRVDRRKRRAKITLELENSSISFDLGFEVLQKLEAVKP